jgi:hypothetical protein
MDMPMPKQFTFDGAVLREMNDAELAQYKTDQAEAVKAVEAQAKKARDRAALLDRLGLTADELATLLS